MYAFVTSAARRGRKEVFERSMSSEERKMFDPAKQREIKDHVANDMLEKLEPHERPPSVGMLCDGLWSIVSMTTRRVSARIVMLG